VAPKIMGIGPVPATEVALAKPGYGSSTLTSSNSTKLCRASACGHARMDFGAATSTEPTCTARESHWATRSRDRRPMLATLARELHRRAARYGLETMCIGGQGLAAVFERVTST